VEDDQHRCGEVRRQSSGDCLQRLDTACGGSDHHDPVGSGVSIHRPPKHSAWPRPETGSAKQAGRGYHLRSVQSADEVETAELEARIEQLTAERDQLAHALESRIVIEQAKGVLAERYKLPVDDAFLLLRKTARSARVRIHELARDVVSRRETPQAVLRGMARDSRLRASAIRERTEASQETMSQLRTEHLDQLDRISQWTHRPTARVRVDTRSDAVDLAARLSGYRWYLIVPDESHWEVVVEYMGRPNELPADLSGRIDDWLQDRGIPVAHVRLGEAQIELSPPASS
jgi:ANTAR domain